MQVCGHRLCLVGGSATRLCTVHAVHAGNLGAVAGAIANGYALWAVQLPIPRRPEHEAINCSPDMHRPSGYLKGAASTGYAGLQRMRLAARPSLGTTLGLLQDALRDLLAPLGRRAGGARRAWATTHTELSAGTDARISYQHILNAL